MKMVRSETLDAIRKNTQASCDDYLYGDLKSSDAVMLRIKKMMEYLKKETVIIPHEGCVLHEVATREKYYRPTRIFKLLKTGEMVYNGKDYLPVGSKPDVIVYGQKPTKEYLQKTYEKLIENIKDFVLTKTIGCSLNSSKNDKYNLLLPNLILRFNGLGFIKIDYDDII